jgi:hypothetical protein
MAGLGPVLSGLVDGVFDDAGGDVAEFDVCGLEVRTMNEKARSGSRR